MNTETIINEKTFTHPVKMALTEKELLAYADELTDCDSNLNQLEDEFSSVKDDYKSKIGDVKTRSGVIMNLLKSKEEFKDIECFNDFNWFEGIVEIKRLDTQETIKTRKITAQEFQQNLPGTDNKGDED